MFKRLRPFLALGLVLSVFFLGGCSNSYVIFDPKGPVAAQQKDLILYSIGLMAIILVVVYVLFTVILVKYRENRKDLSNYDPHNHGSKKLETIWTIIPIIIIIALAIPTVKVIYDLEKSTDTSSKPKAPLVINATAVDWKWIFSYPKQGIETVNYINIPKDRPVLFKLTSADSMSSFWVPQLGGQKYAMSGMETELYLQADELGTFEGRNSNFNGEGFTHQTFNVHSVSQADFDKWTADMKSKSPKLTKEQYDKLMLQGHVKKTMTFSSTHLKWVNHAHEADYAVKTRERLGVVPQNPHGSKAKDANKPESDSKGDS
ncbi:cytochrome aa3 quinol oxidase subunit II [Fictibacillus macauensis ZFHKF-1]|uniref:Quinol oxidase subunit 2 n=1 Tax=Fictibacillus macauensis ZFHKF-1 TaxID=1196324 RepID=I8ANF9_9BACL|nr:cytochrome aa3 quinol oxidase subunit II [Fictibacillus macauensis]EIT87344.1 cytochrome aa3 quinol oxidase subunit II [Fictibacillus macauensis ZFHKF-1]